MRVKIIQTDRYWKLEQEVNTYLSNYNNDDIVSIQYSGVSNHAPYSVDYYSVMIVLKK